MFYAGVSSMKEMEFQKTNLTKMFLEGYSNPCEKVYTVNHCSNTGNL